MTKLQRVALVGVIVSAAGIAVGNSIAFLALMSACGLFCAVAFVSDGAS